MPDTSSANSFTNQMNSELRKVLPDFLSSDENARLISSQIDQILRETAPNMVAAPAISGSTPHQKNIIDQFGSSPQQSPNDAAGEGQSGAYEAAKPEAYEQDREGEEDEITQAASDEPSQEENQATEQTPQEEGAQGEQKHPSDETKSPESRDQEQKAAPPEEEPIASKTEGDPLGFKTAPTEHPMYDETPAASPSQESTDQKQNEQDREKKQAQELEQQRNDARAKQMQAAQGQQTASIASQKKQLLVNASRLTIKGLFALKATYLATDFIDVLEFEDGASISAIFNIVTVATSATVFLMQNGETKKFIINKYVLKACGAAIAESIPIINIMPWDTINGFMLSHAVKKQKKAYNEEIQKLESHKGVPAASQPRIS